MMNYSAAVLNLSEYGPCPAQAPLSPNDYWMVFVINSVIVLISVLGLIGNFISGLVLSMPQMRSSYGLLLTSLTVSDSIQLLFYILFFGSQALKYCGVTLTLASSIGPNFSKFVSMSVYVAYTASAYLTVILSCERYTAVCKPFRALRIFPTKRRSFHYVLGVVIFAILFNSPKWWETRGCQDRVLIRNVSTTIDGNEVPFLFGNSTIGLDEEPVYTLGEIKVVYNDLFYHNQAYRFGYLFLANFIINFLIPLGTLMVLNVWIYNGMRETSRTRQLMTVGQINDNSITVMLIVVVGVFCACHMWFAVKFILQEFCGGKCFHKVHLGITNLLLALNASINFAIYCLCGSKFRQQLQLLFPSFKSNKLCSSKNIGSFNSSRMSRIVQSEVERVQV